jgi:putative ABC transport system ATP-binding protein
VLTRAIVSVKNDVPCSTVGRWAAIQTKKYHVISIENVTFCYSGSDFRLCVPKFQVQSGATVAVVGPSGSGKTTLLNLAAGILVPTAGKVTSSNVDVSSLSEPNRRDFRISNIGLVFQEFELLEHLSVLDNILLPCRISSGIRLSQSHRDHAAELAREVGIGDKLHRYARKLSQGERQRVAVCRALLLQPPLLLCDEPTGNLDPTNKEHVLDILFDYVRRTGATLLAVTHDHGMLERFDQTFDVGQFHASAEGQR